MTTLGERLARALVEQQAYYSATAGRISWMRVICPGFRPAPRG
jgi:hypothetical protein